MLHHSPHAVEVASLHLDQLHIAASLKSQGESHSPSMSSAAAAQCPTGNTQ